MERLAVRWPAWHARLANFLMHDPLRAPREQLARAARQHRIRRSRSVTSSTDSAVTADASPRSWSRHQSAAPSTTACRACARRAASAEIRVVDNASDDGTLEIVQRHALQDRARALHRQSRQPRLRGGLQPGRGATTRPRRGWRSSIPDCLVEADTLARLRAHAPRCAATRCSAPTWSTRTGVRDAAARRRDPDFARDAARRPLRVRGWRVPSRSTTPAHCSRWMRCPAR